VADADTDGRVRADRGRDDRVAEHPIAPQLSGGLHLQVVSGTASHQGNLRPDDAVGPPDDLLLVAGQPVREQHQNPVRPLVDVLETPSHFGARLSKSR
jgi:hypothetical protein